MANSRIRSSRVEDLKTPQNPENSSTNNYSMNRIQEMPPGPLYNIHIMQKNAG